MADIQQIPPSPPIRPAGKRPRPLKPGKDEERKSGTHPGRREDRDPEDKGIDEFA